MENKANNNLLLEELHEYAMETFDNLIAKNGGREYDSDDVEIILEELDKYKKEEIDLDEIVRNEKVVINGMKEG